MNTNERDKMKPENDYNRNGRPSLGAAFCSGFLDGACIVTDRLLQAVEIALRVPSVAFEIAAWLIRWPWLFVRAVRYWVIFGEWLPVSMMGNISWGK